MEIREISESILNFVFPPVCILCRDYVQFGHAALVCGRCWQDLPACKSDAQNTGSRTKSVSSCHSMWQYNDAVEKIIHEMKFFRKRKLCRRVGEYLAELAVDEESLTSSDALVPVPLHRARLRERGYNQSELLAGAISDRIGLPVQADLVERVRRTKAQSQLSAAERQANVEEAFKVLRPKQVQGKCLILVDDVMTTGATLNACADALLRAGASCILGLTVAKTPPRRA